MFELIGLIFYRKHRFRGHYYKIKNNGLVIWYRNFKDYMLDIGSPSLCCIMPDTETDLYIEMERDKHP